MNRTGNQRGKSRVRFYFRCLVSLLLLQVIVIVAMNFAVKGKIESIVEAQYHRIDSVYAAQYKDSSANSEFGRVSFISDEDCYLAVIDSDGNILEHCIGGGTSVMLTNVYRLLKGARILHGNYDYAVSSMQNFESGRVEFYSANQSKILIYTPVEDGEHQVVRIIPKKIFDNIRNEYASTVSFAFWIIILVAFCIFIVIHYLSNYALEIETNNARQEIIAADNNLISFTYHMSIASFEMTGAVNKIFGEEIGKRSQIDWSTLSQLLHPEDQGLVRNMSKAIKDGSTKYTTEFRMKDPNGDYHWYRLNGKSVQDKDGDSNRFVGTIQHSDDQITHENMLKEKAEHDLLTGLLNKVTIEESVNAAIKETSHNSYAFYIIDLDNFKAVNDNLGHAVGDKVLTDVASKLQLIFNEADYIGRLGGDEFAVLLVIPSMMVSQADKLIREKAILLNEMLRAEYTGETISIPVSASIGIASYPDDGIDFQELYRNADKALYYSKEHGKNQFTFYRSLKFTRC